MQERIEDEQAGSPLPTQAGAPDGAPAPAGGNGPQAAATDVIPDELALVSAEEHATLTTERDEYLDALQRLKAEFDNYRRRTERERQSAALSAGRDVLKDLLPVMDNLERAVAALAGQDDGIVAGVDIVRGQLANLLAGRGLVEIEAHERLPFDPTVHEAVVSSHSPDFDEGTVVAVIEKGYRLNDQVVRPAKVVVSAGSGQVG